MHANFRLEWTSKIWQWLKSSRPFALCDCNKINASILTMHVLNIYQWCKYLTTWGLSYILSCLSSPIRRQYWFFFHLADTFHMENTFLSVYSLINQRIEFQRVPSIPLFFTLSKPDLSLGFFPRLRMRLRECCLCVLELFTSFRIAWGRRGLTVSATCNTTCMIVMFENWLASYTISVNWVWLSLQCNWMSYHEH